MSKIWGVFFVRVVSQDTFCKDALPSDERGASEKHYAPKDDQYQFQYQLPHQSSGLVQQFVNKNAQKLFFSVFMKNTINLYKIGVVIKF